ncbi:WD40 repeat domain-containing protein [Bradyrhizobium sp. KB893862 SZCCT0404]|uniref:YncE family protein n=1 Tax=Bradyrhizobium sp. KB893862 SZCCT0404 TaxID=2807672 RepID=UPI001BA9A3A8|nr:WD40 repeat domain-containing protein [Bradyrhizobium sp. KB893862 SZCCT0404]MBR1175268.1 WD40 repeat domain-containing protein [Bradyrhizobium sp. KB893862 SZCCT0404]
MSERKVSQLSKKGQAGGWHRSLTAMIITVAALCTIFVQASPVQAAPKDGLYLYVCLPGNIAGNLNQGGAGIAVFNVDQGYKFVERIPLPMGPSKNGGDPPSCKGIDASVLTGLIYPMMTDRLHAVNLETSQIAWTQTYDGGCCDRGVVSPFGETLWLAGVQVATWYVASAYDGALIDPIKQFPARAHNTQISPRGDQVLLSPANNILYLYDTRTHQKIREVGPFFNRNRPFVTNGDWSRVYANNNGYLGFTAADIDTGKILYRIDAPGTPPCQTSSGAHGTCVHGLALTHDESAMWFPSASDNSIFVYDMHAQGNKHADVLPTLRAKIKDYSPSGWITCGIDGTRMYPASGTVFDTKSLTPMSRLVDENGQFVYSEKLLEVRFKDGKAVQVGDQWCNGLFGSERYAITGQAFGRTAPGYRGYVPPGPNNGPNN